MNVLHVTTGLETGGAETLLFKLAANTDRGQFSSSVLSLTDEGPILGRKIRNAGVPVQCLGFPRGLPHPGMIAKLAREIRRSRPDVVQTWMYHADLVTALAMPLAGRRMPLLWGIHSASVDPARLKRQTLLVIKLCARLSRRPARIVCCSPAARESHVGLGYAPDKMRVVSNGVDTDEFTPCPEARGQLRRELGLSPETPLVGLIARLDPQKDHETFFRAAGRLAQIRPDARFVLCGGGITGEDGRLRAWVEAAGVTDRTHLLGLRGDVPRVTAALDVATCCSTSESFGLTLGEAMACGVPCVTTDLPGPVALVGGLGRVVPVGDPAALAGAWQEMLCRTPNERRQWADDARRRVQGRFSLQKMVRGYEDLYREFDVVGPEAR